MLMEKAIRILVANRPKLMRELLLATLSEQNWIEVVGEVVESSELSDCVDKTSPDLVVIDAEEPGKRPNICDQLLRQHPQLRIIAVATQENYSVCYWASFDIHSDEVEPSEEGLLSAVRKVADYGATGALS
jgi:chemotaxis response regulator CheB